MEEQTKQESGRSRPQAGDGFFLGSLFNPEDGSDIFLQNVVPSPNYMALQLRRPYSSPP
jgi:hypothetical protein